MSDFALPEEFWWANYFRPLELASREVQGGSRCSGGSSNAGAGSRSLQEVPRLVWFGISGDAEAIGIEDATLTNVWSRPIPSRLAAHPCTGELGVTAAQARY